MQITGVTKQGSYLGRGVARSRLNRLSFIALIQRCPIGVSIQHPYCSLMVRLVSFMCFETRPSHALFRCLSHQHRPMGNPLGTYVLQLVPSAPYCILHSPHVNGLRVVRLLQAKKSRHLRSTTWWACFCAAIMPPEACALPRCVRPAAFVHATRRPHSTKPVAVTFCALLGSFVSWHIFCLPGSCAGSFLFGGAVLQVIPSEPNFYFPMFAGE